MVGGLIYRLLMMRESVNTLRLATAVAALAVSQSNVGITDRPQLAAMMARVDLQPFSRRGIMKTLLIIDANLGRARAYMARTLLGAAARKQNWKSSTIRTTRNGGVLVQFIPNDSALNGKMSGWAIFQAVAHPELFLSEAKGHAKPYTAPVLRRHRLLLAVETRSCGDCLPDWCSTHNYGIEAIETESEKTWLVGEVETMDLLARWRTIHLKSPMTDPVIRGGRYRSGSGEIC